MARHTVLVEADLTELAHAFGLGPVTSWGAIEAGTINSNYRFDGPAGRFFLRVNEGKGEADVRFEAALVAHLATRGISTPACMTVGEQPFARWNGRLVSVFPWVVGEHISGDALEVEHLVALGTGLAALHRATADLELEHRSGIYTFEAMTERLRSILRGGDSSLDPVLTDLEAEVEWQRPLRSGAPALAIVHGDLFPDNVLWRGPEIAAFIDFEQAAHESTSYDLAVCINAWCFGDDFDSGRVAALVGGYRQAGGQVDSIDLFRELRRAAWRFTITRITDVHLAGLESEGKDFRRYHRRLLSWRRLGPDGLANWLRND